jgi:hypothetical protein
VSDNLRDPVTGGKSFLCTRSTFWDFGQFVAEELRGKPLPLADMDSIVDEYLSILAEEEEKEADDE